MKNKITVLVLILVFILLIGGSYVLYNYLSPSISSDKMTTQDEAENNSETSQQEPAPDFTVYDKNGKEVKLSDFAGKPVVVNFWASWCTRFTEKKGYTFPVYYDTESNAAITYNVYSLPTTYFIDSSAHVTAQTTGAIDGETLQKGIDMIKKEG